MNKILLFIILSVSVLSSNAQTLKVDSVLTYGNWGISRPIDSLKISDTLVMAETPKVSYGWYRFSHDSIVYKRQKNQYCQHNKRGGYTMYVKYQWDKAGHWETIGEKFQLYYGKKILLFKPIDIHADKTVFLTESITKM